MEERQDDGPVVDVELPPLARSGQGDVKTFENGKHVRVHELYRFADGWDVLMMVGCTVLALVAGTMYPLYIILTGQTVDCFSIRDPVESIWVQSSSLDLIGVLHADVSAIALKMVILSAVTCVALFCMNLGSYVSATRQADNMRRAFVWSMFRHNVGWFDTHQTGTATTLLADVQRIQLGMGSGVVHLVNNCMITLCTFVVAFVFGWRLALVTAVTLVLSLLVVAPLIHFMNKFTARVTGHMQVAGQVAEEAISCHKTVTCFSLQTLFLDEYRKVLRMVFKDGQKKNVLTSTLGGYSTVIMFGCYALSLWYGDRLVQQDLMSPGAVFISFMSMSIGVSFLGSIPPSLNEVVTATGIARKLFTEIDQQYDELSSCDKDVEGIRFTGSVTFRDVSFRYPSRPENLVLRHFDLTIPAGKKCALVGQSGCGKSTVAALLERFYECEDGFGQVLIDGHDIKGIGIRCLRDQIGIVTQEPVLFATTIRENIAWGQNPSQAPANENDIVAAAKLANAHEFITKLPSGYDTLVGERGTQLSGGQKQRIAIARALIKKPKIIIFDEATSALDTKNEHEVQEAIDRVSVGCTCIFIAHRLSTIQGADIIAAIENGHVAELGTHSELLKIQGGVYKSLVEKQQMSNSDIVSQSLVLQKQECPVVVGNKDTADEVKSEMKEEETVKPQRTGFKVLFQVFRFLQPSAFIVVVSCICAICNGAVMPCSALFTADMTNILLFTPESSSSMTETHGKDIMWFVYLFIGAAVVFGVLRTLQDFLINIAAERMSRYLRFECFKAILRQDSGWFDSSDNSVGVLSSRLTNDTTMLYQLTGNQLMAILQGISSFVFGVLVGFSGYWKVALLMLVFIPVLVFISYVETITMMEYSVTMKKVYEEASAVATEGLENVRTVLSIRREDTILDRFMDCLAKPRKHTYKSGCVHGLVSALHGMTTFLMTALAFWYGTDRMVKGDPVTFVGIMRAQMGIAMGASSFGQIMSAMPNYGKGLAAAMHILDLLERKPLVPFPRGCSQSSSSIDSNTSQPRTLEHVRGRIVFDKVHFSYPARKETEVLKGLSLTVEPHQCVALVGESGCGKSTVVSLLERFYTQASGTVSVDGVSVDDLDIEWLRAQIGFVGQEPVLFAASIYDNIRYGKLDATHEDIVCAAKAANAHAFISSFPDGYNTLVGEKGVALSGGQKQRIAIARALVRNPLILVLDEATSALDAESEQLVQDALNRAQQGRTTLVIAHRLSTIQNADNIFVLDNGVVVESGTHIQLLNTPNSLYSRLVSLHVM